jgi:hypothetical protein
MTNQLGFQYIHEKSFLTSSEHRIFPIKIDDGQSALALEINSQSSENNLKNSALTVVLFQDTYDNLFKYNKRKFLENVDLKIWNIANIH